MANCFSKHNIEESSSPSSSSSSSLEVRFLPYIKTLKTKNDLKIEKIQKVFHEEYKKSTYIIYNKDAW
jgi:hypothetical protein